MSIDIRTEEGALKLLFLPTLSDDYCLQGGARKVLERAADDLEGRSLVLVHSSLSGEVFLYPSSGGTVPKQDHPGLRVDELAYLDGYIWVEDDLLEHRQYLASKLQKLEAKVRELDETLTQTDHVIQVLRTPRGGK